MPYYTLKSLPDQIHDHLPHHAQEIYKNSAWEQYEDPEDRQGNASREEVAHRVAWSTVKTTYTKNSETGKWEKE